MGYGTVKLTELVFRRIDRRRTNGFFNGTQIFGGAATAFMHGAGRAEIHGRISARRILAKGQANVTSFSVSLWLMMLCLIVMAFGTSAGGYRIIKAVGMDMVRLEKYQGSSADLAAVLCLQFSSLTGIPVSTTHTKTTAIMVVGAAKQLSSVNWGVVREMIYAWVLTFPGCGLIGFLMVKLFLRLF